MPANPDQCVTTVIIRADGTEVPVAEEAPPPKPQTFSAFRSEPDAGLNLSGKDAIQTIGPPPENGAQSLSSDARAGVFERIAELRKDFGRDYFELGRLLSLVKRSNWFAPHRTFNGFIDSEFGKSARSAFQIVRIYEKAAEIELSHTAFEHLGWTVMAVLVKGLTKENAHDWIKLAETQPRAELQKLIRTGGNAAADAPRAIKAARFANIKIRAEDYSLVEAAIERARHEHGVESDLEALKIIFDNYLTKPPLAEVIENLAFPNAVTHAFRPALRRFSNATVVDIFKKLCAGRSGIKIELT